LFLGGAAYLLATTERAERKRGELLASGEEQSLADGRSSFWRVTAITFTVVAVAEFGDITQVLIANLTAHYRDGSAVFTGAAAAFALVSVVGCLPAGRSHAGSRSRPSGASRPGAAGLRHLLDRLARHRLTRDPAMNERG